MVLADHARVQCWMDCREQLVMHRTMCTSITGRWHIDTKHCGIEACKHTLFTPSAVVDKLDCG